MSFLGDLKNKTNNADRDFFHENENEHIKDGAANLAHDARRLSTNGMNAVADYMSDRIHDIASTSKETLAKAEYRIKQRPGQSVALAFVAGIVTSYLVGRRA